MTICPEYSVYGGDVDYNTCPFRVDEGHFTNTVYVYKDVSITADEDDDATLKFTLEFITLVEDGVTCHNFSSDESKESFYKDVATSILLDMIQNKQDEETNVGAEDAI